MARKDRSRESLNQGLMLCLLGALLFTQACSSIAYVQLNDRFPAKAASLAGKKAFLFIGVSDAQNYKTTAGRWGIAWGTNIQTGNKNSQFTSFI